jgi:hypothetical protein
LSLLSLLVVVVVVVMVVMVVMFNLSMMLSGCNVIEFVVVDEDEWIAAVAVVGLVPEELSEEQS